MRGSGRKRASSLVQRGPPEDPWALGPRRAWGQGVRRGKGQGSPSSPREQQAGADLLPGMRQVLAGGPRGPVTLVAELRAALL